MDTCPTCGSGDIHSRTALVKVEHECQDCGHTEVDY